MRWRKIEDRSALTFKKKDPLQYSDSLGMEKGQGKGSALQRSDIKQVQPISGLSMVRPGGWFGHGESIIEQEVRCPKQDAVQMQPMIIEQEVRRPKQDAVWMQLIDNRAQAVFGWKEPQEPRVGHIASSQTRRPSRQRGMVPIDD